MSFAAQADMLDDIWGGSTVVPATPVTSVDAARLHAVDLEGSTKRDDKTGATTVHGGAFGGLAGDDVSLKHGDAEIGAQRAQYGYQASADATYDPSKGQVSVDGGGRGGGFMVKEAAAKGDVGGLGHVEAKMGEISNDVKVEKVHAEADKDHVAASVGTLDWGGIRMSKGDFSSENKDLGLSTKAGFDSLGNTNTLTDAKAEANFKDLANAGVKTGIGELGYSGWTGEGLKAGIQGPGGVSADAKVGSFGAQPLSVKNANAELSVANGFKANVGELSYSDVSLKRVDANAKLGDHASYHLGLGEFATDRTNIKNAKQSIDANGLEASMEKGSYDTVYVKDFQSQTAVNGLYEQSNKIGEGVFDHMSAENAKLGLTRADGLNAHLEKGNYTYLGGSNIETKTKLLGGMLGNESKIGEANVGGVDVKKLDAKFGLDGGHLDIDEAGGHLLKSKDLSTKQNVGAAGGQASAKEVNIGDASVKHAGLETSDHYLKGGASVDEAKFTGLDVKDAHAGLTWNGKELAGATGSFKSETGVEHADADWNLREGKAKASFENASTGAQLSGASIDIGGHKLDVPDMGAKINASGGGDVDLSKGAANANVGLGGSNVNFAGHDLTVPDWVKAGAGVNMSQGAANWNLGGDQGVGADVNLSQGKLAFNAFGHKLDVGDTAKEAVSAVGDGAGKVWNALTSW